MRPRLPLKRFSAVWPGKSLLLWYGALLEGSNQRGGPAAPKHHQRYVTILRTLLFCAAGFANVRQKTRMRGAELYVIGARLVQAQLAVHGQAHFGGVLIFLAVVFPPANRAQLQGARRFERLISATRATITNFNSSAHIEIDARIDATDYKIPGAICHLHGFLISFWPRLTRFSK